MIDKKTKLIFIFFALVFVDQISKFIIISYLKNSLLFLRKLIGLELHRNYGFVFGVEVGNRAMIALIIFALGLFIFLFYCLFLQQKLGNCIAFMLIFSGAISNLLDRLFRGYVVDFIRFSPILIFNIADIFILAGLVFLFFCLERKKFHSSSFYLY